MHGRRAVRKCNGKNIKNTNPIVDLSFFLTASPHGLVDNNALIEIKCLALAKIMSLEDEIISQKIKSCEIKNEQLHLKRNHNYYYQLHRQLFISCKLYCYFCIWTL
jgi:hypothetical protein